MFVTALNPKIKNSPIKERRASVKMFTLSIIGSIAVMLSTASSANDSPIVVFQTNQGEFSVTLNPNKAPKTVPIFYST